MFRPTLGVGFLPHPFKKYKRGMVVRRRIRIRMESAPGFQVI